MGKEKLDFCWLSIVPLPWLAGRQPAWWTQAVRRLFQCYDNCIRQACQGLENGVSLQAMIHKAT